MKMYGKKMKAEGGLIDVKSLEDISEFINEGKGTPNDFTIVSLNMDSLKDMGYTITGDLPPESEGLAFLLSTLPHTAKLGHLGYNLIMCRINPVDGSIDGLKNVSDSLLCESLLSKLIK